jgi:hypothetical protein
LTALQIQDCSTITDESLQTLASNAPSLRELLFGPADITDIGLVHIAEKCPALTHIAVTNCHGITDQGVQFLANKCTNLWHVDLSYCIKITDAGMNSLAKNSIEEVSFSGCPLITEEGLTQFLKQASVLQILRLKHCRCIQYNRITKDNFM